MEQWHRYDRNLCSEHTPHRTSLEENLSKKQFLHVNLTPENTSQYYRHLSLVLILEKVPLYSPFYFVVLPILGIWWFTDIRVSGVGSTSD